LTVSGLGAKLLALTKKEERDMPVGFNLFSFDLFEAFRRRREDAQDESEARNHSSHSALSDEEEEERLRKETADKVYWGFGYFPVL
jgi:hypothetical protein